MGYESMIEKALAEGELRYCLLGFDEYAIPSRDPRFDRFTDYEILLRNFDWYQQKKPDAGLKDAYELVLGEMLCAGRPADIFCATLCVLVHVELEKDSGFHFHLSDQAGILQQAILSMEGHREAIIKLIDVLFGGQVIAERYYSAALSDAYRYLGREDSFGE